MLRPCHTTPCVATIVTRIRQPLCHPPTIVVVVAVAVTVTFYRVTGDHSKWDQLLLVKMSK